jgi:hypothetical protein
MADWDALPVELKLQILSYYMPNEWTIRSTTHQFLFLKKLEKILNVRNRNFVALALEVYYKTHRFSIRIFSLDASRLHPPVIHGQFIRKLEISIGQCRIERSVEAMLLDPGSGWRYFLKPDRDLGATKSLACVGWQANLTNLDELAIKLIIHRLWRKETEARCGECDISIERRERLLRILGEANICLKARKVQVRIFADARESFRRSLKRCECLEPLEEKMRVMVVRRE